MGCADSGESGNWEKISGILERIGYVSTDKYDYALIEVVEGTGNLDISPVYEHLSGSKPKMKDEKPKHIVIPKAKKTNKKDEDSDK